MSTIISEDKRINLSEVIDLYKANDWSSAQKPQQLYQGLLNSHTLVTARREGKLIGLGNAISDGYLVVYYPHLIVHPDFQKQGIGTAILKTLQKKYQRFHQQVLIAEDSAVGFYDKLGFVRAGSTQSMWIYYGGMQ